jgi:O-antigen/teichoic acid export membrane protein
MGYMASATVLSFCFGVAAIAVQFLVVLLGGGLIGLSVVSAVSAVALRFCTILFIRSRHPALIALRGRWNRECVRSMIAPALKCWLTEMGAVFLLKTDQYFIAYFQGAAQIPAYHAAYTIVHNMALLCVAIGDVSNVYISHLWQAKNFAMIRIIVLRNLRIGLGLMLCGVALLLFAGDRVMALWLGEGQFVGYPVLATFCLTLTLYVQQSLMLGFSRATENEVYATSFLMAGLLNLVLTWCLVKPFGLLGVALGTLIAQLLTTNWYILFDGVRRLRIGWRCYSTEVALPVIVVFFAACLAVFAAVEGIPSRWSPMNGIVAAATAAAGIFVSAFWLVGLNTADRARVRAWGRGALRRLLVDLP